MAWHRLGRFLIGAAILAGVAASFGGCASLKNRGKIKRKEVYGEYLDRLEAAYHAARLDQSRMDNLLPTRPNEAQEAEKALAYSNQESRQLAADLKILARLDPLDASDGALREEIVQSAALFNYYLSYRVMGPIVIINLPPETRARMGLDAVHSTEQMARLLEKRLASCRDRLEKW